MPLQIVYYGARMPSINRAWIDELLAAAGSSSGLLLTDEPAQPPARPDDPHISRI